MTATKRSRLLRNVNMTRTHHYSHMGLWLVLTIAIMLVLNAIIFIYVEEGSAGADAAEGTMLHFYMSNPSQFLTYCWPKCWSALPESCAWRSTRPTGLPDPTSVLSAFAIPSATATWTRSSGFVATTGWITSRIP